MGEGQPLLDLGVVPDSIWGDEYETSVYAQALGKGKAIIFRLSIERDGASRPQSLAFRAVACYHDLDSSIASIWPSCNKDISILDPSVVINLDSGPNGKVVWAIYRDPFFDRYLDLLRHVQPTDLTHAGCLPPPIIDVSQVVLLAALGGRGCSKLVRLSSQANNSPDTSLFAFKGIDFQTYLQNHDDEDELTHAEIETWKRSSKMVAEMPPHPNIQPPPKMLVSVRSPTEKQEPIIIGHLSAFYRKGDLRAHIETMNREGKRIPAQQSARWCHQMSLAVDHTHRVMHTYHMDIKPANIVLDDDDNIIIIDWEQSGAPAITLAPEADGTWDVHEQHGKLVYIKYAGPPRRNRPEGSGKQGCHIWNVFPEWAVSCPRASEQAEVFALGRTMWMLLSQTDDEFEEVEHPSDVQVSWGPAEETLPRSWIEIVERCMDKDPNERPSLAGLVKFWEMAESWEAKEVAVRKPVTED